MPNNTTTPKSIDDVAPSILSERTLEEIGNIQVTLAEQAAAEKNQPSFQVTLKNWRLKIVIRKEIQLGKPLTILITLVGAALWLINLISDHWSEISKLFQGPERVKAK